MAKLFNTQTLKEENLPQEQIDQAVASGTHAYMKGTRLPIIAPDGKPYEAPAELLPDLLRDGARLEDPKQTAVREYVDENKGLKGAAKVALGQFADEALMGLPELVLDHNLDPLELAKKEALKKEHQLVNNIAGVAGFAGSLLYGGPVGKVSGLGAKVGLSAERSLAARLAASGVDAGSRSLAKRILAKTLPAAAAMGTEGVIYSAPQALTEAALGEPELAAETILMNGLGGVVIGGSMAGLKELTRLGKDAMFKGTRAAGQKIGLPIAENLDDAARAKATTTGTLETPSEFPGAEPGSFIDNVPESAKPSILEQLAKKKKNAPEIEAAFRDLGVEPLEGAVSASKFVQDLDSALAKKVSPAGIARANKYQEVYDKVDDVIKTNMDNAAPTTALSAGDKAKELMIEAVEKKNAPFKESYKAIQDMSDTIVVPDNQRLKLYNKMLAVADNNRAAGDKLRPLIKQYGDDILSYERATDMEMASRGLRQEMEALHRAGRFEDYQILKSVKSTIDEFADNEIMRQAKIISKEGLPEAQALAKDFIKQKKLVKKDYAEFKGWLEDLSGSARVRARGAGDLIDNLDDVASEKLVDRLFDKKNYKQLEFIKKEMPEVFDTIVGFKKNQIIEKSLKDNKVMQGTFWREYDKIAKDSPELLKLMFSDEQLAKLKSAQTVIQSLPKDINPSGTARGIDMSQFLSPTRMIMNSITDSGMEKALKLSANPTEGLLYTERAMKSAAEKISSIPKKLDNLFKNRNRDMTLRSSTVGAISRLLGTEHKHESKYEQYTDLKERLSEYVNNPQLSADRINGITAGLTKGGAPTVAEQFNAKNSVAMQYLWDNLPKSPTIDTPFKKSQWQPSEHDLSKLERRVNAILNPLSIIDDLEKGTLSKEAVDAVRTVYPKVFERINGEVLQYFMNNPQKISYNDRIKFSLLLGEQFDPSMSPEYIRDFQQTFIEQDVTKEQMPTGRPMKLDSMETDTQRVTFK